MSKSAVIRCLITVILVMYLVMAMMVVRQSQGASRVEGVEINVAHTPQAGAYVTAAEIANQLKTWKLYPEDTKTADLDLQKIENTLNSMSNIEKATVYLRDDNRVAIDIVPMIPVARVFDHNRSYYINADGKQLTANARFRLDVPIICGAFDSIHTPKSLLPLVQYVSNDSAWNAIVSHILVEPIDHDVIVVPMIRGHVINMGDTSNIADKLKRVMLMYHKVLPVKGWNFYDTISVKWIGQVVATKRQKSIPEPLIRFDQVGDSLDNENINTMLISTTADTAVVHP